MDPALLRSKQLPTPGEIAGRNTDPRFYLALSILPNPDPILRKAGKTDEVFDAIRGDSHVIGELRSIKADLQRFRYKLTPGGDRRVDKRAYELCQAFLSRSPAPLTTWADVIWNIGQSVFRGMSIHEIVWDTSDGIWMPSRLLDRPKRRFTFDGDGQLRILTRSEPMLGLPAGEAYFLVDRHMADYDNPYGIALFSACYWPYVFKHAGYRWFVKFCERFGVPYPVGKYPVGSSKETIDQMEEALQNMVEASYAVIEDGGDIDLKESKSQGGSKLAQHQLIETCNGEMSKALTSQTLATESVNSGSRAASQTHADRAGGVNEGDRERIAQLLDKLWALITKFNCGDDVKPPTGEFVGDSEATKDRADIYTAFIEAGGNPSRKSMGQDLGIALADPSDPDDQLRPRPTTPSPMPGAAAAAEFSEAVTNFVDQTAIDTLNQGGYLQLAIEALLKPLMDTLKSGLEPEALKAKLATMYPQLNDVGLAALLERAMFVSMLLGRVIASEDPDNADG